MSAPGGVPDGFQNIVDRLNTLQRTVQALQVNAQYVLSILPLSVLFFSFTPIYSL